MKKNAMLKIAAILMVAVLLTTCAVSSTFAKYATDGSVASTNARVAKWGITVTADTTNNLFGTQYGDADSLWVATSVNDEKVVAPGTTGSAPSFAIAGTTEVAVNVAATANVELANWYTDIADDSTLYCPLVVTVAGTALTIGDGEDLEDFEEKIEAAIVKALTGAATGDAVTVDSSVSSISKDYAPNATLGTTGVAVSWAWALGAASADDTALGTNAAAGNGATISVTYGVTIEQINPEANSGVKTA